MIIDGKKRDIHRWENGEEHIFEKTIFSEEISFMLDRSEEIALSDNIILFSFNC